MDLMFNKVKYFITSFEKNTKFCCYFNILNMVIKLHLFVCQSVTDKMF